MFTSFSAGLFPLKPPNTRCKSTPIASEVDGEPQAFECGEHHRFHGKADMHWNFLTRLHRRAKENKSGSASRTQKPAAKNTEKITPPSNATVLSGSSVAIEDREDHSNGRDGRAP